MAQPRQTRQRKLDPADRDDEDGPEDGDDYDDEDGPEDGDDGRGGELVPAGPAGKTIRADARVFEVAFDEPETKPFALVFRNNTRGTTERHDFEALEETGAGGVLAVSSLIRYDPRGRQIVDLSAMLTFFERVLVEGDYERLKELLDRRDLVISMDQLGEVFNWLVESYTGRPTRPSSGSAASRPARGRSSRASRR